MKKNFFVVAALCLSLFATVACQKKTASTSGLTRVHFDFDSASLKPDMVKVMDGNAGYLKKHANIKVVVEGHSDERGTNEYNLALGDRRANATKGYLVNKGVSTNRLRTVSYGEEKPLEKGHNEAAWYMNRRADFTRD